MSLAGADCALGRPGRVPGERRAHGSGGPTGGRTDPTCRPGGLGRSATARRPLGRPGKRLRPGPRRVGRAGAEPLRDQAEVPPTEARYADVFSGSKKKFSKSDGSLKPLAKRSATGWS